MGFLDILNKRKDGNGDDMSFVDHIDELRGMLFRSLLGILVAAICLAFFHKYFLDEVIFGPTNQHFITYKWLCALGEKLHTKLLCITPAKLETYNTSVNGQLNLLFTVVGTGGIILAFPWIIYQLWGFIKPALKAKELKYANGIIFWVSLLFFVGVLFGYFVLAPYSIAFMSDFTVSAKIKNLWSVDSYLETFTALVLGTGLAFQLPLAIYFLSKLGIVTKAFLVKYSRYAIVAILVLAAVITPPDIISQIIVSLPLLLLFYIGIIIAGREDKKRLEKEPVEWS
jgi:sec-independent protein translocase protein TatC